MMVETQRKGKKHSHAPWFIVQQLGHATVCQEGACLTVKVTSQSVKGLEGLFSSVLCVTIGLFLVWGKIGLVQTWILPFKHVSKLSLILWQSYIYLFIDEIIWCTAATNGFMCWWLTILATLMLVTHGKKNNMRITNNTCAVSRNPCLLVLNSHMNPLPSHCHPMLPKNSKGDLATQAPCRGTWWSGLPLLVDVPNWKKKLFQVFWKPLGSMYGIFTFVYMDGMGDKFRAF